jgi:hypothetical protein
MAEHLFTASLELPRSAQDPGLRRTIWFVPPMPRFHTTPSRGAELRCVLAGGRRLIH